MQIGRYFKGGGLSVEICLELADLNDAPDPTHVLEDFGLHSAAKRLRKLFGTPGRDKLTRAQQDLHHDINDIDPADWRLLRGVIRKMAVNARLLRKKRA